MFSKKIFPNNLLKFYFPERKLFLDTNKENLKLSFFLKFVIAFSNWQELIKNKWFNYTKGG